MYSQFCIYLIWSMFVSGILVSFYVSFSSFLGNPLPPTLITSWRVLSSVSYIEPFLYLWDSHKEDTYNWHLLNTNYVLVSVLMYFRSIISSYWGHQMLSNLPWSHTGQWLGWDSNPHSQILKPVLLSCLLGWPYLVVMWPLFFM